MDLIQFVPFLSVFALALVGVASLTLSMTVWRRRRHALDGRSARARAIGRVALMVGVLGCVCILLSLSLRSFFPRRGELFVRDSVVIRADTDRGLPVLASGSALEAGAVLVTFSRPGLEAEQRQLRLEERRLLSAARRREEAPLEVDVALTREHQELVAERRHLLHRGDVFRVEQQRLDQQARTELLAKRIQRGEIQVQLSEYAGKVRKLESELVFARIQLSSAQGMRKEDALSEIGLAERRRNIDVVQADLTRLARERADKQALLNEMDRGIEALSTKLEEYAGRTRRRVEEVEAALAALRSRAKDLETRRQADLARVRRARTREIDELALQASESRERYERLEQEACIRCPGAGRVHYRHPSPRSAGTGEPLVLFGPSDTVRARFRLTGREASLIRSAGSVDLLATSHELLEDPLTGELSSITPIEHEPGMVVAELVCDAAPGQLAFLSRGITLESRLLWVPPLWVDPLLWVGAVLLGFALLPSILWRLRRNTGGSALPSPMVTAVPPTLERKARHRVKSGG